LFCIATILYIILVFFLFSTKNTNFKMCVFTLYIKLTMKIVLINSIYLIVISLYFQHHEQVQKYSSTLEGLLFTPDIDIHILEVFHQFLALHS
jgi:hypothetical protein